MASSGAKKVSFQIPPPGSEATVHAQCLCHLNRCRECESDGIDWSAEIELRDAAIRELRIEIASLKGLIDDLRDSTKLRSLQNTRVVLYYSCTVLWFSAGPNISRSIRLGRVKNCGPSWIPTTLNK